jgi:hypothetical protein
MASEARTVRLADESITLRTWYRGCYRLTLTDEIFGQIKREGTIWAATVRSTNNGGIIRFAGEWETLRDAVAELVGIRDRQYRLRSFTMAA